MMIVEKRFKVASRVTYKPVEKPISPLQYHTPKVETQCAKWRFCSTNDADFAVVLVVSPTGETAMFVAV